MPANNILAHALLALAACGCVVAQSVAQDSGQPQSGAPQPPSQSSSPSSTSSGTHPKTHRVQVPDEDAAQPAELTQAEAAIEKKQYVAAQALLHKFLERNPANYVAWFDLGFTENALGNVDASIAAYRKSVAAKPDVFESNLNLGLQLAKTSQPEAEDFLRAATKLKPTSHVTQGQYRAWASLGNVLAKSKPDDALEAYRRAAVLQPKETEPHLAAGVLLEQENKFADAESEYQQALEIDPASSEAVLGLANIYMRGRRFPEAEEFLRKLLIARPGDAPVEVQLGRVLAAQGKTDEAIAALQAAIKSAPEDEGAQRDLADLYFTSRKFDLAATAFGALVAAHPNDAELHRRLGQAMLQLKKPKEAQQQFLESIKLKPESGDAYGDLAFAASENENYELTIKALSVRSKFLPENPVTYFLRASASDHLKDFKTAAANYHLFLNTANGKYPDYEWKAKHRLITIEPKK
jgi:tetratricopeptide (TPR) repeat protein